MTRGTWAGLVAFALLLTGCSAGVAGQAAVAGPGAAGSVAGTGGVRPSVAPTAEAPESLPSVPTRSESTGGANGTGGTDDNGGSGNGGGTDDNGGSGNGGGTDDNGGSGNGGGTDDNGGGNGGSGNGGGTDDNGGSGNGGGNGGSGNGGGSLPGVQFVRTHKGEIVDAAIAWSDARNAGDGQRTLALGCSDDVAAVQAGQPNPASYAGYSAIRPTGEVNPHASGLAAYVFISRQDLHTGGTTPGTMPVVYENGGWHVCWYPGANTQRIISGG